MPIITNLPIRIPLASELNFNSENVAARNGPWYDGTNFRTILGRNSGSGRGNGVYKASPSNMSVWNEVAFATGHLYESGRWRDASTNLIHANSTDPSSGDQAHTVFNPSTDTYGSLDTNSGTSTYGYVFRKMVVQSNGDAWLIQQISPSFPSTTRTIHLYKLSGGTFTGPTTYTPTGSGNDGRIIDFTVDTNDNMHLIYQRGDSGTGVYNYYYVPISSSGSFGTEMTVVSFSSGHGASNTYSTIEIFGGNLYWARYSSVSKVVHLYKSDGLSPTTWTDLDAAPGFSFPSGQVSSMAPAIGIKDGKLQILWIVWDGTLDEIWQNAYNGSTFDGAQLFYDIAAAPGPEIIPTNDAPYGLSIGDCSLGWTVLFNANCTNDFSDYSCYLLTDVSISAVKKIGPRSLQSGNYLV